MIHPRGEEATGQRAYAHSMLEALSFQATFWNRGPCNSLTKWS